jgi:SecD/SecF fusion protein
MADIFFQLVHLAQQPDASSFAQQYPTLFNVLIVLAVFVLPFVLARVISGAIRLPAISTRLGFALAATIAGLLFVSLGKLEFGPDMKGGTTMIFNIDKTSGGEDLDPTALASALSQRVDPSGTKEITIRPRGADQIEITVPTTDAFELQVIKERIIAAGQLEFRVVANSRDHEPVISLARAQANLPDEKERKKVDVVDPVTGRTVGRWYLVGRARETMQGIYPLKTPVEGDVLRNAATGMLLTPPARDSGTEYAFEKFLKANNIENIEVLMAIERNGQPYTEVFGDDLASASAATSNLGEPNVTFQLSGTGADRMLDLTSSILPDGQFHRRMAIVMDKQVLSAPQVNNAISSRGEISGRFTQEEVNFLCNILREGRLPATLEHEPASETRVGAGLGEVTIAKGKNAAVIAIVATAAVMVVYYQFSGLVACLALALNCLLIFGIIIFIRQPLSLPGLAGIVLTIGMAVDANVLVFERIREERAKGAAPRLSIRNGFDRASATIVDANLTTLIAGIVLYWIGTEQVRGFAVTLIIGIVTSMFTAVFCSRILFEIAEKLKIVSLSMIDGIALTKGKIVGDRDLDFMRVAPIWFFGSVLFCVIGIAAAIYRGKGLLNIDFTGGETVTYQLREPIPVQQMREIIKGIFVDQEGKSIESSLVRVENDRPDTIYVLTTSIGDEKKLGQMLSAGLAKSGVAKLVTYDAKVTKDANQGFNSNNRLRFVSVAQEGGQTTGEPNATQDNAAQENLPTAEPNQARVPFVLELTQEGNEPAKRDQKSLKDDLVEAAKVVGVDLAIERAIIEPDPLPADWRQNQTEAYSKWSISLPLPEDQATKVVDQLAKNIDETPIWLSLSSIRGRVAAEMQQRALAALVVSMILITLYIWFRFQKLSYGLAAVFATLHDVIATIGAIALSHWCAKFLGFALIEDFKIGLTEIAALLAIIGYSLNDTIVIFDRIRELRGRSPRVTVEMLNKSLNQTLSRTILTSGTTLLTVFVLYVWGGEGIHTFAFALLVGITVGTYSSIYIATPILLWLANREVAAAK